MNAQAQEIGRLAGAVLFPLLLAGIVWLVGWYFYRKLEQPARERRRKTIRATAGVIAIVGMVVGAVQFSMRDGSITGDRGAAGFLGGIVNGCRKTCMANGFSDAQCSPYCTCTASEIRKRVPPDDLSRAAAGRLDPNTGPLRAHIVAAAQACLAAHPLRK